MEKELQHLSLEKKQEILSLRLTHQEERLQRLLRYDPLGKLTEEENQYTALCKELSELDNCLERGGKR